VPRDFQRPFVLPRGATELILIRHGSARRLGDGSRLERHSDPALTELGESQAAQLRARLRGAQVAGLYVTPLRRTQQTAAPLAEDLGIEPVVLDDLREVYLGEWEDRFNERIASDDPLTRRVFETERWDVIPGAESMELFSERVHRGIEHIVDSAGPDRTAIAVVHGGVIAEACRQVTSSRPFAFLNADNCSLTRLMRTSGGRWTLISFNDTAHL
jgi:2,3-bisphosphoglycerate-dependent phosphoglycerate mutase